MMTRFFSFDAPKGARTFCATSSTLAILCAASSAWAQQATTSIVSSPTMDEVVVTANKRSERLHDVPAVVTAVTGASLAQTNAVKLEDYVATIPGLSLSNTSLQNAFSQIAIRGITTGIGGGPTVGIYIDDLPFGSSVTNGLIPDLDPQDLLRVEVLQGPQGTLYGAGSMGGLFKYVTASPDPSHMFGHIQVDGSQVDGGGAGYGVRGSVNIPITNTLALRASAYDRQDPGYITNVTTNDRNVNATRFQGGRLALGWQPSEKWNVTLRALIQDESAHAAADADYSAATDKPLYGPLSQARLPGTGGTLQAVSVYSLEIEGDLGWSKLTSSTSYDHELSKFDLDFSQSLGASLSSTYKIANVGANIGIDPIVIEKFTQEIRFSSDKSKFLSWQAGGFYTQERNPAHEFIYALNGTTGAYLPVAQAESIDFVSTYQEEAGFGDATLHLTPKFDLTGGVRYSHNEQYKTQTLGGKIVTPATVVGRSNDNSVTYLVTPQYRVSDDVMIYARVSSGYRPGGINLVAPGTPLTFGPDTVTDYEAGVKAFLFDKSASLDFNTYYIDWQNIQLFEIGASNIRYTANAGSAKSQGATVSADWKPVRGLNLSGALSYDNALLTAALPPGGGLVAASGAPLPFTAPWTGNVAANYEVAIRDSWLGLLGADVNYHGSAPGQFPAIATIPRFQHPAYTVLNLRVGYKYAGWSVTAYAKNVTNSLGQTADLRQLLAMRVAVNQPRTFGLSLGKSF